MNRIAPILIVCMAISAEAQTSNVAVRALSLSECLATAVRHNFDVQIEEKGIEMARHEMGQSYGVYDPVLRAGLSRGDSLSAGGIDDQNRAYPGTQTRRDTVYDRIYWFHSFYWYWHLWLF